MDKPIQLMVIYQMDNAIYPPFQRLEPVVCRFVAISLVTDWRVNS